MAHQPIHSNSPHPAVKLLFENGFEGIADALTIRMNEAMSIERDYYLHAAPHQRTSSRRGYANGFKPKTVETRSGSLPLRVPQVRDLDEGVDSFYPQSLERGLRSFAALETCIKVTSKPHSFSVMAATLRVLTPWIYISAMPTDCQDLTAYRGARG